MTDLISIYSILHSPVRQEAAQLLGHLLPDVQHQLLDTELPLTLAQAAAVQGQHREANNLNIEIIFLLKV